MFSQKILKQASQLSEAHQQYLRYIAEGSERMRLLISDLLRYNRIERDLSSLRVVASSEAVQAAITNLAAVIEASGAVVEYGELPRVRAHPGELTQVFQNLLHNAIKYASKGKPHIEIAARKDGDKWEFSVRDNGIGIEPKYHQRIFEVFQRLHSREEYPGTGMGLAICKKIIDHHGGTIRVESTLGAGSTFIFTLPKA